MLIIPHTINKKKNKVLSIPKNGTMEMKKMYCSEKEQILQGKRQKILYAEISGARKAKTWRTAVAIQNKSMT